MVTWRVPTQVRSAAIARADGAGVPASQWLEMAVRLWVADLPHLTTQTVHDQIEPPFPASARLAIGGLYQRTPTDRRAFDLCLYLLVDSGWRVLPIVGSLTGATCQADLAPRISRGRRLMAQGHPMLANWLTEVPPVPVNPISPPRAGGIACGIELPHALATEVREKAALMRWTPGHGLARAMVEGLYVAGYGEDGRPLATDESLPSISADRNLFLMDRPEKWALEALSARERRIAAAQSAQVVSGR